MICVVYSKGVQGGRFQMAYIQFHSHVSPACSHVVLRSLTLKASRLGFYSNSRLYTYCFRNISLPLLFLGCVCFNLFGWRLQINGSLSLFEEVSKWVGSTTNLTEDTHQKSSNFPGGCWSGSYIPYRHFRDCGWITNHNCHRWSVQRPCCERCWVEGWVM